MERNTIVQRVSYNNKKQTESVTKQKSYKKIDVNVTPGKSENS